MSNTTASDSLCKAHRNVYDMSSRISDALAPFEGTGVTLTFGQIADAVGINLRSLSKMDGWLFYMSAEAATEFRGWSKVSNEGEPARFTKKPTVTVRRKSSASPAALRKVGR